MLEFPHILCFGALQRIKQFLLLSKRRSALITQCLIDSETSKPNFMPRLYINRRLAMEHRDNPSLDPSCKNTVFTQVHAGLPESFIPCQSKTITFACNYY